MTNMDLTRRTFVVTTAAAGGGLMLGVGVTPATAAQVSPQPWMAEPDKDVLEINRWVAIDPGGVVTIRASTQEMGQGIFTATPMMLNEELQADWNMIHTVHADVHRHVVNDYEYAQGIDLLYGQFGAMHTEASASVVTLRAPLQQAGASARERLKAAAAAAWGVNASQVVAKDSVLTSGNNTGTYGEFATAAASIQLPEEPSIKTPDQFTLIGTSVARLDTPLKVNGSARYGMDTRLPGMLYAAAEASPVPEGRLVGYDASAILDRPGVVKVVELVQERHPEVNYESFLRSGVAVVADSWYRAKTALELMPKEWDDGPGAGATTANMFETWWPLLDVPGVEQSNNEGNALEVIAGASNVIRADYQRPFTSHATMEPLNATVSIADDRVDLYISSQRPDNALEVVAEQTGYDISQCYTHPTFLGCGFGRRASNDDVRQAAEIARQVGGAVKTVWTREEDFRQAQMRSMTVARLEGALGPDGIPSAVFSRSAAQEPYARSLQFPYSIPNQHHEGHQPVTMPYEVADANGDLPYRIRNRHPDAPLVESHIPGTHLRDVSRGLYDFVKEQFFDEMALAGGWDPLELRIEMTQHRPEWRAVLQTLKEVSGYTMDLPRGSGMGVAIHEGGRSIVAHATTVSVSRRGQLSVEKVVVVVDAGHVVSPALVTYQMQSGLIFELGHALRAGIEIRGGRVVSDNFDTYQLTRIGEMPEVEVHFALSGGERWGGIGEMGVGVTGPAVANAIFAATGNRVRSTPILSHDLSWS